MLLNVSWTIDFFPSVGVLRAVLARRNNTAPFEVFEAAASHGIDKIIFISTTSVYADDFNLPGQVYAYLVRSPHSHARILNIDVAHAMGAPGVIAVLTGSDAAADGLKPIPHSPVPANPHEVPLRNRDGSGFFIAPHPVLAVDVVRYVGEPIAIIVAETLANAMDAAERVEVVYEPVAAVRARETRCRPERRSFGNSTAPIGALIPRLATRRPPRRLSRGRRILCA
jgi:xanthine dehydrogenase molybdopterin-binding subunit B